MSGRVILKGRRGQIGITYQKKRVGIRDVIAHCVDQKITLMKSDKSQKNEKLERKSHSQYYAVINMSLTISSNV